MGNFKNKHLFLKIEMVKLIKIQALQGYASLPSILQHVASRYHHRAKLNYVD